MEIMELAATLGDAIKESDEYKALKAAQTVYENDHDLLKEVMEYNVQSKAMQEEYKKENFDKDLVEQIEKRVNELYKSIVANEHMAALQRADEGMNQLMNKVNEEITYHITGERPCTHDCSSCGGSCHDHDHHHE